MHWTERLLSPTEHISRKFEFKTFKILFDKNPKKMFEEISLQQE